jgi:hypothetical protein
MERITITAAELISIGYDSTSQTLEVEFDTGHVYQYLNVPEKTYLDLLETDLQRRYFHKFIIYGYPYRRMM